MNAAANDIIRIVYENAICMMASIANVTYEEIEEAITADPKGAAARRFADYMALGIQTGIQVATGEIQCPPAN